MKRTLATLLLTASILALGVLTAATVSAAAPHSHAGAAAHSAAAQANSCASSYSGGTGVGPGTVTVPVPGYNGAVDLTGTASAAVCIAQTTAPCPSLGGVGIKVSTTGSLNLHLTTGNLYMFNPSTGQCTLVAAITSAGVYQVVAPSVTRIGPASTGSAGSTSGTGSSTSSTTGGGGAGTGSGVGLPTTGGGGGQSGGSGTPLAPIGLGLLLVLAGAAIALRRYAVRI